MNVSLMGKMEELRLMPISQKEDGIGSFFYDELDALKSTHNSQKFYTFYLLLIDRAQSLALILVNKEFICDTMLDVIDDSFFLTFISKLLIAFLRDCGTEANDLF